MKTSNAKLQITLRIIGAIVTALCLLLAILSGGIARKWRQMELELQLESYRNELQAELEARRPCGPLLKSQYSAAKFENDLDRQSDP